MKKYMMIAGALMLAACTPGQKQVAEMLTKNPKMVFDAIEENPEQFIEVVNRAARKAQEQQQQKQQAEAKKQQEDQLKNPLRPELSEERLLAGSKDGEITIVEYADFQCPACRMAYDNLKPIKDKYKDRIKFYYKNMPLDFHKMAMPSALYYEAVAKQDRLKAKKYYDILFQNQDQLGENFLRETAQKVGADMKRLTADLKSEDLKKTIAADMAEFEKLGFTGTPAFIINGVAMSGAQPAGEFEKVIQLTTKSKPN